MATDAAGLAAGRFGRDLWALLALYAGLLALTAWVLGGFFATRNNTLGNRGHWLSTKTLLANGVNGAFGFLEERQSLAGQKLNLGSWNGFQEILYRDRLDLGNVSFDFMLAEKAYIYFIFNKDERGFSAIRFSLHPLFPSAYFTADNEGRFLTREPIDVPDLRPDQWQRCEVAFSPSGFKVTCGGRETVAGQTPVSAAQLVGFRGCQRNSFLDNVQIRPRRSLVAVKPPSTIYESFGAADGASGFLWRAFGIVAGLHAPLLLLAFLVRGGPRIAMLRMVTLGAVLLAGALLLTLLQARVLNRRYPNPGVNVALTMREEGYKSELRAKAVEYFVGLHSAKDTNAVRVLFMGSSQTYGVGAMRPEDAIPRVAERELSRLAAGGKHIECINGGLSGFTSDTLRDIYRDSWLQHLKPDLTIVNLSNNDMDRPVMEAALTEIVALSRQHGVRVLFVTEPNTVEQEGDHLPLNHAVMRRVAEAQGVPLVDMQAYMNSVHDVGMLWWDHVHPTSLGQRLFAEHLVARICELKLLPSLSCPNAPAAGVPPPVVGP